MSKEGYSLRNTMYIYVEHKLDELKVTMPEIYGNEKNKLDIMALALNELPPKYVVTKIGDAFARASEMCRQFEPDVTAALIRASKKVNKDPQMERE